MHAGGTSRLAPPLIIVCTDPSSKKKDGRSIGRDASSDNGMRRTHIHVLFELTRECENFNLLYPPLEGASVPYSFRTYDGVRQVALIIIVVIMPT